MGTATARSLQSLHFDLPPLPWAEDALEPVISAQTIRLHHGKHHRKYVDTMNELLAKENVRAASLEEVVRTSKKDVTPNGRKLFNNAAQAWNHEFYWHSLAPQKGLRPSAALRRRLEKDFGSFEGFGDSFAAAAVGQFGSGWAWLVDKGGKLEVTATSNADTPMAHGVTCLLTVDVWEHAYYLDYRNERDRYVSAVLDRLNWDFAERNLKV